jgi:hypothetical protein
MSVVGLLISDVSLLVSAVGLLITGSVPLQEDELLVGNHTLDFPADHRGEGEGDQGDCSQTVGLLIGIVG